MDSGSRIKKNCIYEKKVFYSDVVLHSICFCKRAENGGYPPTQNGDIRSLF